MNLAVAALLLLVVTGTDAFAEERMVAKVPQPEARRYATLWQASKPDFVVYLPSGEKAADAENQHLLVVPVTRTTFAAVWTQASRENDGNQRVVFSKSTDRGKTWSDPFVIDGEENGNGQSASWGFPIVAEKFGRIYVFYNKNVGNNAVRRDTTGIMKFRYSDDQGKTWSRSIPISMRRTAFDGNDSSIPQNWVVFQAPVQLKDGAVMVGFTKWKAQDDVSDLFRRNSEVLFMRFDNVQSEKNPEKLKVSVLPDGEAGLRVPSPSHEGKSVAQEPTVVQLSDGSLFTTMRTLTGRLYCATSSDKGKSWSVPEPLLYADGGAPVLQPIAPAHLYRLENGKFLLVFHNNDGTSNGGKGPADFLKNRTPAYFSIASETLDKKQPLSFSQPRVLVENGAIPAGAQDRTEIATYTSFFESEGRAFFWYPDRKHFLLGKDITSLINQ